MSDNGNGNGTLTRVQRINGLLQSSKAVEAIKAVLPRHMNHEKLIRITSVAVSRTPQLQECDPISILTSVVIAARLGLEPDGILGSAYLVPFFNKNTKRKEAQLIPGYRGLIDLARRSGSVLSVDAQVVRDGDEFEYEFGLTPKLRHKPALTDDEREMRAVYAIAHIRDGEPVFEVMSKGQIESIKRQSKATFGPWVDHFEEMARKTVIRRLCKRLPLSVELAAANHLQAMGEIGEGNSGVFAVAESLEVDTGVEVVDSTANEPRRASDSIPETPAGGGRQVNPPADPPPPPSEPGELTLDAVIDLGRRGDLEKQIADLCEAQSVDPEELQALIVRWSRASGKQWATLKEVPAAMRTSFHAHLQTYIERRNTGDIEPAHLVAVPINPDGNGNGAS